MAKKQKDALIAAAETIGSTLGSIVHAVRQVTTLTPAKPVAGKKVPIKRTPKVVVKKAPGTKPTAAKKTPAKKTAKVPAKNPVKKAAQPTAKRKTR